MDVLIVEDEPSLARDMQAYLQGPEVRCRVAGTVRSALDEILDRTFDCIVLDLTLPDGNGLEVLRELKRQQRTDGVVIVSAKDALSDRIEGLRIGADDYITKPFHFAELAVRVQATVRRAHFNGQDQLEIDGLRINLPARLVFHGDHTVPLTATEFDLLRLLVANKDRVVARSTIAAHLSGDDSADHVGEDLVYAHMKNLKRKLGAAGFRDHIRTVYGIGYSFTAAA